MRDILLLSAVLLPCLTAACAKPDITSDTYYCGPEALCPPDLACQFGDQEEFSFSCVVENAADGFACPLDTSDQEPDDTQAEALDMGVLDCGSQMQSADWGCIADGSDVDHYQIAREGECVGSNPRFTASLRFPIGAAPLSLDLINAQGELVAAGVICTDPLDASGTELRCVEEAGLPLGDYTLRVQMDASSNADCDGNCQFNHYQLVIAAPAS